MNRKLIIALSLSLLLVLVFWRLKTLTDGGDSHLAPNAWWLEPSNTLLSARTDPVGYRFNVTVWISCNTTVRAWQFGIVYDRNYLNATGAGYTRPDLGPYGKSDFFKNITTMPVPPAFGPHNATHNFVIHGEIYHSEPFRNPGHGSCAWVEFEVVAHPPVDGTSLELAFDHVTTVWWDPDRNEYREGWHNGFCTIS